MASSVVDVKWQTSLVIQCLFEDEDDAPCRQFASEYETDGPDDGFDPVVIGDKLRHIGDDLNELMTGMNENMKFRELVTVLKQTAAQETINQAFSHCVDAVRESRVQPATEVAPEVQLIQATAAFGLYVKKVAPELKAKIQNVIISFLDNRVGTWINQQGGWNNVPGL